MIRQEFYIEKYWKVIVYYNVDYDFFGSIRNELLMAGAPDKLVNEIKHTMHDKKVKGVTFSDELKHISIVLFNRHKSKGDYINTIVHEAEHVKQAVLHAYHVKDKEEDAAYTIGYIVMRMYDIVRYLI